MKEYDFSTCKLCRHPGNTIRYRLQRAHVYVCSHCGFHYTDYLDEEYAPISAHSEQTEQLDPKAVSYIREKLESNAGRFQLQEQTVIEYVAQGATLLDVGFGGGIFLRRMKEKGFDCYGIELDRQYLLYAREYLQMQQVESIPIQDAYWQEQYRGFFKVIVLWDVLEHVNFPLELVQAAVQLLQPGGYLFIDTPCRDALYHRSGEWMSRISGGRFNGLLNLMYSNHRFGHKQIFSKKDMQTLFKQSGLEMASLRQFHEMSFPYLFYLRKITTNRHLLKILEPMARFFFSLVPIRNKMMVVGRRGG